jgi:uncharacterized protein
MRLKSLALGSLVLAAAGSLLWLAALGARRHRDRFHYHVSGADPQLASALAGSSYERRELTTAPGVTLQLIVRRPASDEEPFLLLFPGNAERQLSTGLPIVESLRANHPAGAAVVSYRGFEGSTGTPSPRAAAHDTRALLEYLHRELGISGKRLILVGYSLGSGIAVRAAAELAQRGQEPMALVLMSPFWRLEVGPAGWLGPLLPSEYYTVEEVIPYVRSRTLILGAGKDGALPVAKHAQPLAAALGARARYVELPDAGHADYLQDASVMQRVARWLWEERE